MSNRLANKVTVITGGNSGIGFGIAQEFQQEGAKGAIVGRNQETLDRSAAQLGDDFIALKGDVTQLADLDRVFKTVADKQEALDLLLTPYVEGEARMRLIERHADTIIADIDHAHWGLKSIGALMEQEYNRAS